MSIKFDEALDNEILSHILIKSIQRKCKCGADIVFSDSLRSAYCSKENCVGAVIDRVHNINKKLKLNISDIGVENIVRKLKMSTPYQIFMLEAVVKNGAITHADIHNLDDVLHNLNEAKNKEYYIYEIAEMSGLISIANTSKAISLKYLST